MICVATGMNPENSDHKSGIESQVMSLNIREVPRIDICTEIDWGVVVC